MQFNQHQKRILANIARNGFARIASLTLSRQAIERLAADELCKTGLVEVRVWTPTTKSGRVDKRCKTSETRFYPTEQGMVVARQVELERRETYRRIAAELEADNTDL